jgi:hypothetical protein
MDVPAKGIDRAAQRRPLYNPRLDLNPDVPKVSGTDGPREPLASAAWLARVRCMRF